MRNRIIISEKPLFFTILIVVIITGGLTITSLHRTGGTNPTSILCTFVNSHSQPNPKQPPTTHISAILHYATTRTTAQQTLPEIKVAVDVLQTLAPCNLLVFGIGHESVMWASLNPRGTTLFLEDDLNSVHKTLNDAPSLRVHHISYDTQLSDADYLLTSYKTSPKCLPTQVYLKGNTRCKLALSNLPEEVYKREWDAIIIDGPKGYYGEAPGRMMAIFSAAVMARRRERGGDTHVFVHDVNRKVEKEYAEEFLCKNYLVTAENRLWHFRIPPSAKESPTFC
ncbi:putative glucuronoxylan 4-O-methyltransferase [Helianthus annuus]|uniref:Glucuronoxylan 4-O-methyltransferase n=1 Tax=Helianthus annuus TaxID=4232 RepID=A0A251SKU6_HELAN|nr:probable methyltransferase At1g27930 [Helianthus annuus]KAF5769990.1 putative glucuronoxylan 4-O-methyltransferase [Helianthus annuus]KAJ0464941.1 putative glucuronoxylan 4-O-methyltransferase [Helianthus annuus]KAJ0486534.1 putative glucuronoxylan 4-O-methyltransferase [Helianthus annuus]KAJ0657100.1 putative glucuronoxylan 4-O-methyltransferase [Helianthus annuus]KAJ0660679.1 putative glucuronoxylan 4-O-methyltransferase [Helianthus annuus]